MKKHKEFFGKNYSDYENLFEGSIGHDLVATFPMSARNPFLYINKGIPVYLENIINNCLHKEYRLVPVLNDRGVPDKNYLFEKIKFNYHYQFKLNKNIKIGNMMEIIQKFIKDWNHEYISYSDNMIIVNKKYYESK